MIHNRVSVFVPLISLVVIFVIFFVITRISRSRGYLGVGGRAIVRCKQGHLFSTIWVPGASLKAIRLGFYRLQFCPVGRHWTLVRLVKDTDLTDSERVMAENNKDSSIF